MYEIDGKKRHGRARYIVHGDPNSPTAFEIFLAVLGGCLMFLSLFYLMFNWDEVIEFLKGSVLGHFIGGIITICTTAAGALVVRKLKASYDTSVLVRKLRVLCFALDERKKADNQHSRETVHSCIEIFNDDDLKIAIKFLTLEETYKLLRALGEIRELDNSSRKGSNSSVSLDLERVKGNLLTVAKSLSSKVELARGDIPGVLEEQISGLSK